MASGNIEMSNMFAEFNSDYYHMGSRKAPFDGVLWDGDVAMQTLVVRTQVNVHGQRGKPHEVEVWGTSVEDAIVEHRKHNIHEFVDVRATKALKMEKLLAADCEEGR